MEQHSPPNRSFENWIQFDSHKNEESQLKIEEFEALNEDDEEALSLCDLATNEQQDTAANDPELRFAEEHQEDFDFGGVGSNFREKQMCSADDVFFRGQILPLRHSVSSDGALPLGFMTQNRNFTRSVSFSRPESVSVISSRSSSVGSHNSASSGSSTSAFELTGYKPRIRNQFHSQPSPTPQIRTPSFRRSNPKTSSKWSFLQLGLLKPQEIGLADLKYRSRRSNSSSTSSSMNGAMDQNQKIQKKKKQQQQMKHRLLFGGCRCSANAIESTVSSSRITMGKETKFNEEPSKLGISKESNVGQRKHAVSRHRTFEWLKQLSIYESAPL